METAETLELNGQENLIDDSFSNIFYRFDAHHKQLSSQLFRMQSTGILCDLTLQGCDGSISIHYIVFISTCRQYEIIHENGHGQFRELAFSNCCLNALIMLTRYLYLGQLIAVDNHHEMQQFAEVLDALELNIAAEIVRNYCLGQVIPKDCIETGIENCEIDYESSARSRIKQTEEEEIDISEEMPLDSNSASSQNKKDTLAHSVSPSDKSESINSMFSKCGSEMKCCLVHVEQGAPVNDEKDMMKILKENFVLDEGDSIEDLGNSQNHLTEEKNKREDLLDIKEVVSGKDVLCPKKLKYSLMCRRCESIFVNKKERDVHQMACFNLLSEKIIKCRDCQQIFCSQTELCKHKRTCTAELKGIKCRTCHETFYGLTNLRRHKKLVHSISYKTPDAAKRHREQSKKDYYCKTCEQGFVRKLRLLQHNIKVHGASGDSIQQIKCDKCDFTSAYQHRVKDHISIVHDKTAKFKCNECHKLFLSQKLLDNHVKAKHLKIATKSCPHCSQLFRYQSTRNYHIRKEHFPKNCNKAYHCEHCNFSSNYESQVKEHLQEEHSIAVSSVPMMFKGFKCEICTWSCHSKASFDLHVQRHSGSKAAQCNMCKKYFASVSSLNAHKRYHQSEKLFKCRHCHFSAAFKSHLAQHERRLHSGQHDERPFFCCHCNLSFTFKQNLNSHIKNVHGLINSRPAMCAEEQITDKSVVFVIKNGITLNSLGMPDIIETLPTEKKKQMEETSS